MTCAETRDLVLEHQAARLAPDLARLLEAHLATCGACTRVDRAERELTELLAARLPRTPAPPALVRRIARLSPPSAARRAATVTRLRWALAGASLAAAVLLGTLGVSGLLARHASARGAAAVTEAINDHLRVLVALRPMEIESGGTHQVKPWFEGRLDFAPVVPDLALAGLELRGGAVGYFLDRRAALLQYKLRAHLVTLIAFRPDGLPLDDAPHAALGERGFHAVLWRVGPVGYAVVADIDPRELEHVAAEVQRVVSR